MHGLQWPDQVLRYVVVAIAAGFPVVVGLAWIFDLHAGRIERTPPSPHPTVRGVRLLLALAGIGVLAAARHDEARQAHRGDCRIDRQIDRHAIVRSCLGPSRLCHSSR